MSQSISALNIQPVSLDTIPRREEGSKAVLITQRWNDPALVAGVATYNLLRQFQSGQFNNIQAAWIDNSTCPFPVALTCLETGHIVRCPAFAQGMYPVISASAPVFTLANVATFVSSPNLFNSTTRLTLLNTPQRYFQNLGFPAFQTIGNFSGTLSGSGVAVLFEASNFGPTNYLCMTGFDIALNTGGAWPANTAIQLTVLLNGVNFWFDVFNITPASFGAVYSRSIRFPARSQPVSTNDGWSISMSTVSVATVFYVVFYYDIMNVQ